MRTSWQRPIGRWCWPTVTAGDVITGVTDYLVDHAVRVVAWYIRRNSGTGYTVRRARHQGIEVLNLYEDKMNPTLF